MADGILHGDALHVFTARHIVEGFQHQEDRAALIGLHPRLILGCEHFEGAVPVQGLMQLTELSVPVDQQDVIRIIFLKIRGDHPVWRPEGVCMLRSIHGYLHHFRVFHKIPLNSLCFPYDYHNLFAPFCQQAAGVKCLFLSLVIYYNS